MKPNLLKIYTKVKSQKILAEGYDRSDIPQIFELFKSQDKSAHEIAMQMLYGKDDNGVPNFDRRIVFDYVKQLFDKIMYVDANWYNTIYHIKEINLMRRGFNTIVTHNIVNC